MGFFDNAIDKKISKFIYEFTGQVVQPVFHLPCTSTVDLEWDGWLALDQSSIWLVNKWGARGVNFSGVTPTENWGQWPYGTRGFPNYRFEFIFNNGAGKFTVYPKTALGGAELNQRFIEIFNL